MTIPALNMLYKMKRAQLKETGTVYIDNENWFLCTVQDGDFPVVKVSIQNQEYSFYSIVEYLIKQGLVREETPSYVYAVTHEGWYIGQTAVSQLVMFPILVPIVVSAVTTLVALWINGLFQGIIPAQ